jgi:hypothetical protein
MGNEELEIGEARRKFPKIAAMLPGAMGPVYPASPTTPPVLIINPV